MTLLVGTALFLAVYNNVTNLVLPDRVWRRYYVLFNVVVALGLTALARLSLSWTELGLTVEALPAGLAVGAAALLGTAVVLNLVPRLRAPARFFADQRVADLDRGELLRYVLIRIPLGTAFLEEVAFRGVLFGAWEATASTAAAVIGSSAVFGLWHVGPTWEALRINRFAGGPRRAAAAVAAGVVATGLGGVLLATLRVLTGGIWAPLLVHASVNTVAAATAWRIQKRKDA